MANRSAEWYRNVALAGAVLAVLMVPAMEWVMHEDLSLWLHIPIVFVVLHLMAGGAAVAGLAFLEYQARSANRGQQAQ